MREFSDYHHRRQHYYSQLMSNRIIVNDLLIYQLLLRQAQHLLGPFNFFGRVEFLCMNFTFIAAEQEIPSHPCQQCQAQQCIMT